MARLVAKIGTSSITDANGVIDVAVVDALSAQLAALRGAGHEVVLVSSGAVSAGVAALGLAQRPADVLTLQALSALGQSRLMSEYNRALGAFGHVAAQALLVPHDFIDRRQYLHTRAIFERLLELGVIPIVNENDAIASDEIRYGDNDRIAALLANNLSADLLVLLTDLPGLYSADPRLDPSAALVAEVSADDPLLAVVATDSGTNRGSGGMASKLAAARVAAFSGVTAVIAAATRPNVLVEAAAGESVGTRFAPSDRRLSARKLWIGFAGNVAGVVDVDHGARRALAEHGRSLLPAGVAAVEGQFAEGDVVEIRCDGVVFARGLSQVDAATLQSIRGRRTSDISDAVAHEVVHRDDLVLL